MKYRHLFILILLLALIAGCERPEVTDDDSLVIGTFNIAWLGDGLRDRKDRDAMDYKLIAETIKKTDADVLALQEIENDKALYKIIQYLPKYTFYCGKGGRAQNTAVLFRKNVEMDYLGEYLPLKYDQYQRPGLLVRGSKGNFDWKMLVVHFKSTSRYDNTKEKLLRSRRIRTHQAFAASRWADSVLALGNEEDLFIVGDFNDSPRRKKQPTLGALTENENLNYITADLKSCKYPALYVIDHIMASDTAMARFIKGSTRVYDFNRAYPEEAAGDISDHCPILCTFDITAPDND
jgi:endonuclease/exonuclease/phosphatase family metal-dependent hydrolase